MRRECLQASSTAKRCTIIQILFVVISTWGRGYWCWGRSHWSSNRRWVLSRSSDHFATILVYGYICATGISYFVGTCVIRAVKCNSFSCFVAESGTIGIKICSCTIGVFLEAQKICLLLSLILFLTVEIFLLFWKWNFRCHLGII